MFLRVLLIFLLVTGCGRALTPTESAFLSKLHGDSLNQSRMRMIDGALVGGASLSAASFAEMARACTMLLRQGQ